MVARIFLLVCLANVLGKDVAAQSGECTFKPPFFLMHFGKGTVQDINISSLALYDRVSSSCPTDGHYTFTSYTSDCFRGDWHTLTEDHTPGDVAGNMLLVNSAYDEGLFLTTKVGGFKGETTYQFGIWLMNVCRPSDKCPYPLLPNLTIRLQTLSGRTVAQFLTGELPREAEPRWIQHRAQFAMPRAETELVLSMINNAPGGCGNDFALDDITFRECIKTEPAKVVEAKKVPPVVVKKKEPVPVKEVKKSTPVLAPVKRNDRIATVGISEKAVPVNDKPVPTPQRAVFVPVPLVLKQRTNSLAKHIETTEGEIVFDLYDNGEIDGDTVTIYHNNTLIVAGQQLSRKPISFRIRVDKNQPHHELVMVADNLGSIPPNTSVMMVTANDKRYQVFISSTEQQNAKVVIDLKE
ncbi:MAG TPA: hypothetical protein VFT06_09990 [Flavisolibacter sp.]|nr:hypothetical protein [Flavisolibacter sp.]